MASSAHRLTLARATGALLVLLLAAPASADDLDTMRAAAIAAEIGGTATPDMNVTRARASVVSSAQGYLNSIVKTAGASLGSWSDINYSDSSRFGTHFARLHAMARAYNIPDQSLFQNAGLLTAIENALSFATRSSGFFCATCDAGTSNWWFWEIGCPNDLSPALLLMKDQGVSQTVFDTAVTSLRWFIGDDPTTPHLTQLQNARVPSTNTGQNLIWAALNHMYLGLIQNDATRLATVKAAFDAACAPVDVTVEGIQHDGSFHQHGAQLYSGGYGSGFADDVSKYFYYSAGTTYAPSQDSFGSFVNYIATGTLWTLYGDEYDVSTISREVTRASERADAGLAALLRMSLVPSSSQSDITSAAKQMLGTWPSTTYPIQVSGFPAQVQARTEAAAFPSGHRHFPDSDHSVHRRPGYYASIKMLSTRMLSGEIINNEGKRGSRLSDGRLYLVSSGNEYFSNNVWPTMDWTRLPGITVEQKSDTANATYGKGTQDFVGGTGDGQNGVSAMSFAAINSSVTAKKAWVFFDDAVVFLASDITCPTDNHVETVVQQWPVSSLTTPITVDGQLQTAPDGWSADLAAVTWAQADGQGYYFFDQPTIHAELKTQSGAWSDLGTGSTTTYHNPFLTLLYDHGTQVSGARAAYALLPNVSADQMQAWAAAPPISVLVNDTTAAAAKDSRNNAVGIVFWQPGTVAGVTSDAPAVAFVVDDGNKVTVAAADPARSDGTLTLTFAEPLLEVATDPGVTVVTGMDSTTITVPRAGGVTGHATVARSLAGLDGGPMSPGDAGAGDGGDGSVSSPPPDSMGGPGGQPDASADGSTGGPGHDQPGPVGHGEGGCSCRSSGSPLDGPHAAPLLLVLLGWLVLRSRREN
jgi:MYXO-CTERM domain-containing protein